jgi:ABC-2 type transport system permease protein
VGYVDRAGVFDAGLASQPDNADRARAYADQESALSALEREEIQAFFVFPPDYMQTLRTDLYYLQDPPGEDAWGEFDDFVRANLVAALPEEVQERVLEGPDITVQDIANNRKFSKNEIANVILPFAASFLFFFSTMSSAGYMLRVVADEKENRMMEVMVTSVTPGRLIGGKAVGLLAAALTQLFTYVVAAVVGIAIAASRVTELQELAVPWAYMGVMALFFFPAFALISAAMVAVGGAVTEMQQGQQVAGILNLLFMLPLMLLVLLFENPSHPVFVFMTLFPTTAFLSISLRWGLGAIPLWQLGLSWTLLIASTIFMVWATARIFRAGMLRYGQPLNLKAALRAVRGY